VAVKQIGELLKEKRTELGLGLNEAEKLTKIPKLYIVALETGDYKALPGEFYVKAYLKQYAEKLHMDADKIMSAYEGGAGIQVEDLEDTMETYRFIKPSERYNEEENDEDIPAWTHYVPIILLSAVAIAIVAVVAAVVWINRPKTTLPSYTATSAQTSSSSSKSTQESSQSSTGQNIVSVTGSGAVLTVNVTHATNPVKLTFMTEAGASSTISLTDTDWQEGQTLSDTQNTATATLLKGQTETVIAMSMINGVTMTINNQKVDLSTLTAGVPVTITVNIAESTDTSVSSSSTTATSETGETTLVS
jgi:cytoskeletal protein RodZ